MGDRKAFLAILKVFNESLRGVSVRFNDVEAGSHEWHRLEKDYCICLGRLHGAKELAYALGIINNEERTGYTWDLIYKLENE